MAKKRSPELKALEKCAAELDELAAQQGEDSRRRVLQYLLETAGFDVRLDAPEPVEPT